MVLVLDTNCLKCKCGVCGEEKEKRGREDMVSALLTGGQGRCGRP